MAENDVRDYERVLCGGIWCIVQMEYYYDEADKHRSPFMIHKLTPIQMPSLDFEEVKAARAKFTDDEWIAVVLKSVGMEPVQFNKREKWLHLARLIPLVENNYNLVLSQKRFAESDEETIKIFENNFVANLKDFKYTSIFNIGAIEISRDNYMLVIDRFDMKFDSSASDNIRAIWSYTLALLQTSEKQIGNHPGVLIFDEPTQHSIGAEDANAFFKSIIALGNRCQVIVGITVNNADIKNVISNLEPEMYKYIHIGEKAFV